LNQFFAQGGSVVRTLAKSKDRYTIRGLTRNVSSPKAEALKKLGIEMHQADVDDPDSLRRVFEDAQIIFAMTDFWQHMSATKEEEQGKRIMDIAADLPHLEQIIWASLPDANTISNGKYPHVYHWQSKVAVSEYIQTEKPALWKKTTAVLFPNYFENCLTQPRTYLPIKVRCRLTWWRIH
jgi:saccharopine dehydrogenase-like NADP-dependent oxidoreductase